MPLPPVHDPAARPLHGRLLWCVIRIFVTVVAVRIAVHHAPPRLLRGETENFDGLWTYSTHGWWVKELHVRRSGPHNLYMMDPDLDGYAMPGHRYSFVTHTSSDRQSSLRLNQAGFFWDPLQFDVNITNADGWVDGHSVIEIWFNSLRLVPDVPLNVTGSGTYKVGFPWLDPSAYVHVKMQLFTMTTRGVAEGKRVEAEVTISGVTYSYIVDKATTICTGGAAESLCVLPVPSAYRTAQLLFQGADGPAADGRFVITEQPRLIAFALFFAAFAAAILPAVAVAVFVVRERKILADAWRNAMVTAWKEVIGAEETEEERAAILASGR